MSQNHKEPGRAGQAYEQAALRELLMKSFSLTWSDKFKKTHSTMK
jgi:hypothetical protein